MVLVKNDRVTIQKVGSVEMCLIQERFLGAVAISKKSDGSREERPSDYSKS